MSRAVKLVAAVLMVIVVLGATGCEQEGAMERAGKAVDEAVEDAGEAIEDAQESVEDAVEEQRKENMKN